jgi:hypothetical protein
MPSTNIQTVLYSDNSDQIVDKLNNNFDEIVELHGGTLGITGPTGSQGSLGANGSFGPTGLSGPRGTRWFISTVEPSGYSQQNDYWIDSNSTQVFELNSTGWVYTGYNINISGTIFRSLATRLNPTTGYAGGTGIAVGISQILPENYLYILSDVTPESGITNETLSKFLIATDSTLNDAPLLEFSKSNVESGQISDYSKHPIFSWVTSNPSDDSLQLVVPGGIFSVGLSGGLKGQVDSLDLISEGAVNLDYGTNSSGGIYSTGGFLLDASSGQFNISSQFLRISGGSGEFRNPVSLNATLGEGNASTFITVGGTSGLVSSRTGDIHSTLSHSVYHILLETSTETQFSLNTKGKLTTKKTIEGISYPSQTAGATGTISSDLVNWYFISKPGTTVSSSILANGNTMIISPSVSSGKIGVGFYNNPNDYFGWGGTSGIKPGESMDVKVYLSSENYNQTFGGISYLGVGATAGNITNKISLPFRATSVDFTIARGVTGGQVTTVYYTAYGLVGGSGGSFTF